LKPPLLDPAVGSLIVSAAALLFAVAGAHKLRGLARFEEIFAAYRVLPAPAARCVAWLVPSIELAVAGALLYPPTRRWGVTGAVSLLLVYAAALGLNLARGNRDLDCGCGTAGDHRAIAAWMMWRNVLLAVSVATAAWPWASRALALTDLVTITGALLAGVLLYAAIDRLLGEVAPRAARLTHGTP